MIGIYKITNPKGCVYICQSINIENRFKSYRYKLAIEQPKLNRSFVKYGIENHIFEKLIECEAIELNDKERFYQEAYNCIGKNGLNLCYVKSSDRNGFHSEETKQKISLNNARNGLGTKLSEKRKEHLRNINLGKKHTAETLVKMSKSQKKVKHFPLSDETKQKLKNFNLGKTHSEETKLKMRLTSNNLPHFKEKRAEALRQYFSKNRQHSLGIKQSKENILKRKAGMQKLIILDTSTGIFFFSITEASNAYYIHNSTLSRQLNGVSKNKTNLIKL